MTDENGNTCVKLQSVDPDSVEVELVRERITQIINVNHLEKVEVLRLRWNLITKIENLVFISTTLRELDLSDNQITKMEGLETLINLQLLDLSYNRINKIECLSTMTKLKTLFLTHNKIKRIENLESLMQLEYLELGDNQIEKIENLHNNTNLMRLYLGANHIERIENLGTLSRLDILSISCNGIRILEVIVTIFLSSIGFENFQNIHIPTFKGLEDLTNLTQLSLCQNGIEYIGDALKHNSKLKILDLNQNCLKRIDGVNHLKDLTDFWAMENNLTEWSDIVALSELPHLVFVYLHSNPCSRDINYRRRVIQTLPQVTTIDGDMCRQSPVITSTT